MLKCEECEREFQDYISLGSHIGQSHRELTTKGYYDKYLKKDPNEGICVVCGNSTKFVYLTFGYNKCCSRKCSTNNMDYKKNHEQIMANLFTYFLSTHDISLLSRQKREIIDIIYGCCTNPLDFPKILDPKF